MTEYLDSESLLVNITAGWTDIIGDVIGGLQIEWGIQSNAPLARVADTGTLKFDLNNYSGAYTPGISGALAGWKRGTQIKYIATYDGIAYTRFYGVIDQLEIHSFQTGYSTVSVTAVDWMEYAGRHPFLSPQIAFNLRSDVAVTTLLGNVARQPLSTSIGAGQFTYPTVFDISRAETYITDELIRLVESELGFAYLRSGETFVFEGADTRPGTAGLSVIPVHSTLCGKLKKEDGDYLLLETGDKLLINEVEAFNGADTMTDIELEYGACYNHVKVSAYPRTTSAAVVVLYSLGSPMKIKGDFETKVSVQFSDVNSKKIINGTGMIAPVATTDYLMNSKEDGTGTDMTGSLTVTAVYNATGCEYTLANAGGDGYVTKLQARGYGVYSSDPIDYITKDDTSIADLGYLSLSVDQKYQNSLYAGTATADSILYWRLNPHTEATRLDYVANRSKNLMTAALNLDVGSLIKISETAMQISGRYYVQGLRFVSNTGGIVQLSIVPAEHPTVIEGNLRAHCLIGTTYQCAGVDYGYIARIANTHERTLCAWIRFDEPTGTAGRDGVILKAAGITLTAVNYDMTRFTIKARLIGPEGYYQLVGSTLYTKGTKYHVAVSYRFGSVFELYVNGAKDTGVTVTATATSPITENGYNTRVGGSFNGRIYDPRVYNEYMSSYTDIYNSGTPDATKGLTAALVFQGLASRETLSTLAVGTAFCDGVFYQIGRVASVVTTHLEVSASTTF